MLNFKFIKKNQHSIGGPRLKQHFPQEAINLPCTMGKGKVHTSKWGNTHAAPQKSVGKKNQVPPPSSPKLCTPRTPCCTTDKVCQKHT